VSSFDSSNLKTRRFTLRRWRNRACRSALLIIGGRVLVATLTRHVWVKLQITIPVGGLELGVTFGKDVVEGPEWLR
jgi:hypothetical protein